jgi:hypothetical protein
MLNQVMAASAPSATIRSTASAAADLHLEPPDRQVQLIMDDDQVDRPAVVHAGLGDRQLQGRRPGRLTDQCTDRIGEQVRPVALRQQPDRAGTEVVPSGLDGGSRVAEPDDQHGGHRRQRSGRDRAVGATRKVSRSQATWLTTSAPMGMPAAASADQ